MKKIFDNIVTISLILFIVLEIVSIVLLVSDIDLGSSRGYCLYALLCLVGILGSAYLKKERRIGGILVCVTSAAFIFYFIYVVDHILLIVSVCYFLLFVALFLGSGVWSDLKSGMDYKHMRHTLQLIGCLAFVLLATTCWVYYEGEIVRMVDPDAPLSQSEDVDFYRLDANDITLEEIRAIENKYNKQYEPAERDEAFVKRIIALKHLYVSGILAETHTSTNLVNICNIYEGDFSPEQQTIINWFLSLEIYQQKEWDNCQKAVSLLDFQSKLKNKIKI